MVSTIVRGHRLDGYLNGTRVRPVEFLPADASLGEDATVINPEFESWIVNDELLLGWLYGSMTESIATEVMGCDSSTSLWQALETLFGAHSRVKMDEYRTKIQTYRKGTMSMADYLRQKRQWADVEGSPSANVAATRNPGFVGNRSDNSGQYGQGNRVLRIAIIAMMSLTWVQTRMVPAVETKEGKPATMGNGASAFIATPEMVEDTAWYVDSGANNHITADSNNLTNKTDYNVEETLTIGNGNKLDIAHVGTLKDGLYQLTNYQEGLSNQPSLMSKLNSVKPFTGVVTVSSHKSVSPSFLSLKDRWHKRLGHPSNRVLNKVLNLADVKVNMNEKSSFCEACQFGKSHALPFNTNSNRA
uniref:GAG-pre-integrase domain-containing protein n=1 Tax=Cannabis sativa TaxID=3483 RepID=A0A803PTK8_CANSA